MNTPYFPPEAFERLAHRSVIEAGRILYGNGASLQRLQLVGEDFIATFGGSPGCRVVLSRDSGQSVCTCGCGYGGACEHVIAAMFAVNDRRAVQVALDFDAPVVDNTEESPAVGTENENSAVAEIETMEGSPAHRLYLREFDDLLLVELRFAYLDGAVEFSGGDRSREKLISVPVSRVVRLRRSFVNEMEAASRLREAGLIPFRAGVFTPDGDPVAWVREALPLLSALGFEVYGKETLVAFRPREVKPSMTLSMTAAGNGMVDCLIAVDYGGVPASLAALFDAVTAGRNYVKLTDGTTGMLPAEWVEKLAVVVSLIERAPKGEVVSVRKNRIAALDLLESIADSATWEGGGASGVELLSGYAGARKTVPVPKAFQGALRSYQQEGYEWFYFLQEFALGGCLADDMGLGKTIQTLALLLNEKERGAIPRSSLLVVPASLLFNWEREARTFAPSLLVMRYHGPDRKRFTPGAEMALADVVLTTYGTLQRELAMFKAMKFNYVILDEAQSIKNPLSESARAVRTLAAGRRLALSGTPIENNLSELWSLFTFLNPGMLGGYRSFAERFKRPIERERSEPQAAILRKLIAPCILRRTKALVAKELPPKTEIAVRVEMTPHQRTLYSMAKEACRADVARAIDDEGMDRARMQVLQALTRLRQICCHPLLVDPTYKGESGKFEALDGLIENVIGEGHKALVFSQFVSVLDLLRGRLDTRKIRYEFLSGKTVDRQKPVDRFQGDASVPLMLVSLKAGGVGLNLTAADYVIMVDPWWNPAAENQAADRAYRIGQTKPVFVYKLITEDSVEERVVELQRSKRELFDAVIMAESPFFRSLDRADIEKLFD
jgi:non-specific serine/threonine protein kinase